LLLRNKDDENIFNGVVDPLIFVDDYSPKSTYFDLLWICVQHDVRQAVQQIYYKSK